MHVDGGMAGSGDGEDPDHHSQGEITFFFRCHNKRKIP